MARQKNKQRGASNRFVNFRSITALSIKDLLEARDTHHIHLANLLNVIGTAVGLYRIRKTDPDAQRADADWKKIRNPQPRTLQNTVIRSWSWPCVLVFVDTWVQRGALQERPDELIPSWIYLPDGRRVPVCVVWAPRQFRPHYEPRPLTFPSGLMGGGYPVVTAEQGSQRVGTIACLATDDHGVYALTNRHVVGRPDTVAYTIEQGELRKLGVTEAHTVGKEKLEELYPGWIGRRTEVNIDAGLFRVDDLSAWTSQVYGLGRLGVPIDLSVDTMSLGLIGCPVRAFGGVSGDMRGCIQALFYRYRSTGGVSYLADFIIGPRDGAARIETQPGDSGTLWVYDEAADVGVERHEEEIGRFGVVADREAMGAAVRCPLLRPLAMQWGGQSFLAPDSDEDTRFVLATTLSNVCRTLGVEILRDWAIEHSEYWGKVGHYKIAYSACLRPFDGNSRLRTLLRKNVESIGVSDADIENGQMPKANSGDAFVALADVPDLVWRATRKRDQANHFADMDQKTKSGPYKGQTLLEMWLTQPKTRAPKEWEKFYSGFDPVPKVQHRGALPFRVKQLFEEMVACLAKKDLSRFVCVAGVLAHYIGDACQPLHVSHLHHGRHEGEQDVHSVYETKMLDRYSGEYIALLNAKLSSAKPKALVTDGDAAAHLTVLLMRDTIKRLAPHEVIDVFNEVRGRGQLENMWNKLKKPTVAVSAEGVLTLACLWQSAWVAGKGESKFTRNQVSKSIPRSRLRALYNDERVAQARWLRDMQ